MKEIKTEDMKYVIVTHLDKVAKSFNDDKIPDGATVYLGVVGEDESLIQFCALKGYDQAGLQYGQMGGMPKDLLEQQIGLGWSEKISVEEYVNNYHEEDRVDGSVG